MGPLLQSPRKQKSSLTEGLDHATGRTNTAEGLEEELDTFLDLLIRVADRLLLGVVDEPDRQRAWQLAAARFVQDGALQTGPQHMQFGFAHRALQPEQKAVVEVGRVVNSIFIEDERIAERADLQQPMPVGAVPRQPGNLQAEHDARLSQTHLGYQLLEAFAIDGRGTGLPQIAVDDNDPLEGPT